MQGVSNFALGPQAKRTSSKRDRVDKMACHSGGAVPTLLAPAPTTARSGFTVPLMNAADSRSNVASVFALFGTMLPRLTVRTFMPGMPPSTSRPPCIPLARWARFQTFVPAAVSHFGAGVPPSTREA